MNYDFKNLKVTFKRFDEKFDHFLPKNKEQRHFYKCVAGKTTK